MDFIIWILDISGKTLKSWFTFKDKNIGSEETVCSDRTEPPAPLVGSSLEPVEPACRSSFYLNILFTFFEYLVFKRNFLNYFLM